MGKTFMQSAPEQQRLSVEQWRAAKVPVTDGCIDMASGCVLVVGKHPLEIGEHVIAIPFGDFMQFAGGIAEGTVQTLRGLQEAATASVPAPGKVS